MLAVWLAKMKGLLTTAHQPLRSRVTAMLVALRVSIRARSVTAQVPAVLPERSTLAVWRDLIRAVFRRVRVLAPCLRHPVFQAVWSATTKARLRIASAPGKSTGGFWLVAWWVG